MIPFGFWGLIVTLKWYTYVTRIQYHCCGIWLVCLVIQECIGINNVFFKVCSYPSLKECLCSLRLSQITRAYLIPIWSHPSRAWSDVNSSDRWALPSRSTYVIPIWSLSSSRGHKLRQLLRRRHKRHHQTIPSQRNESILHVNGAPTEWVISAWNYFTSLGPR